MSAHSLANMLANIREVRAGDEDSLISDEGSEAPIKSVRARMSARSRRLCPRLAPDEVRQKTRQHTAATATRFVRT